MRPHLFLIPLALIAPCEPAATDPAHDLSTPSSSTGRMGFFTAAVVLIDVDRDGHRDLVTSNGNDWSPQPLAIHHYRPEEDAFAQYPGWFSETNAHRHGLAAGDLDGDEREDLVAAVHFGTYRDISSGGFEIFHGRALGLDSTGELHSAGAQVVDVALGDVDADGDLDVAVAAALEIDHSPGRVRLFLNRHGVIEQAPAWESSPLGAAELRFADVDADGWLDLVAGGTRVVVHRGRETPADSVPFEEEPDWASEEQQAFSIALDVGRVGYGPDLSIAVTASCPPRAAGCTPAIRLYRPSRSRRASWSYEVWDAGEQPLELAFAPAEGARLDLIAGAVTLAPGRQDPVASARILIFGGNTAGLSERPVHDTPTTAVVQELVLADVTERCELTTLRVLRAPQRASVVTLPEHRIEQIDRVSVGGVELRRWRPESIGTWNFSAGTNYLTISPPLERGQELVVEYTVSSRLDLIIANGDPRSGNHLFLNRRPCAD